MFFKPKKTQKVQKKLLNFTNSEKKIIFKKTPCDTKELLFFINLYKTSSVYLFYRYLIYQSFKNTNF